jgi:monofunctional glycosyltransferase
MPAIRTLRAVLLAAGGLAALWAAWLWISLLLLPPVEQLARPRASLVITVRDWNRGEHAFVVGPRNPHWTPISSVPASLKKAVVAAEDGNFYSHEGVDHEAIREAIKADLREGRFARGGSTITQQVAKNLFLSREKTISRKIKEYVLARRIDDALSKSRILELYLNVVELGPMVHGVGHASRYYFGKVPRELSLRESAFLAAMLPGPKIFDPYRNFGRVVRRSDRILRRMLAARMISAEEYRAAVAETPNVERLARKVERTMASPPPDTPAPAADAHVPPADGPPEASPDEVRPEPAPDEAPREPAPGDGTQEPGPPDDAR